MLNCENILEFIKCLDRALDFNGRQKRHCDILEEQVVKKEVILKAEVRTYMFSLKSFLEIQVEIFNRQLNLDPEVQEDWKARERFESIQMIIGFKITRPPKTERK